MAAGLVTLEGTELRRGVDVPARADADRRRFTIAVVVGIALVAIPYLWVLWDLWSGTVNPLRGVEPDNFYALQARAIFHGHLFVPPGKLGIEAFLHGGHQYTYFGLFPSILRMPVLVFTSGLDGQLTAPSLLLAWLVTGAFSSMLLWRVRILIRGRAVLGRAEAASFGVLAATITGGSVLVTLAATPFVYNEDFAWSVALTLGTVFALLGVLERPSWGRVTASGLLILAANLNRAPTGYACVIGALLVAAWFASGRAGTSYRRWVLPLLAAGLVPLAASCAVTWIKFGLPFGLPMADQIWAHVNAHRRYFLAANGGKAFSVGFLPSTMTAYLAPTGIHFSSVFPFISMPATPARAVGGVVLDQTYPTASIPATMPLLVLLGIWGLVTAFRPRSVGLVRLARIPLLAAAAGVTGVMVWGYIADRYMSDFLPVLILASAIGLVDIWRRLDGRRRMARRTALGVVTALGLFCIVVNVAIAATPSQQFTPTQNRRALSTEKAVDGQALRATVEQGPELPYYAPAGQLFAASGCSGLYRSTGITFKDVPAQQIQHFTWAPVEQGAGINHTIGLTFNVPVDQLRHPVPILTFGRSTLLLERDGPGRANIRIENPGAPWLRWPSASSWSFPVTYVGNGEYKVNVTTDPNLHSITVDFYGAKMFGHYLAGKGPAVVATTPVGAGQPLPPVSVRDLTGPPPAMSLCRSLVGGT